MSGFMMRPVGDRACIIDLSDLGQVMNMAAQLRELQLPGVIDIVPAVRTVLVVCVDRETVLRVMEVAGRLDPAVTTVATAGRDVSIDVIYDGADLAAVAELSGLSIDSVIAAHEASVWSAAFGGFAPGFVYLTGGDPRLRVPRLESPRTRVPAGSVALAGEFSAVYPSDSPGGWQLIGRTEQLMWDEFADPPTLIQPGDRVRFRAVAAKVVLGAGNNAPDAAVAARHREADAAAEPNCVVNTGETAVQSGGGEGSAEARQNTSRRSSSGTLIVERVGMQTLVQDGGRPGYAALGITDSGALDRASLRRANAAVGNVLDAAGLENLNGGLVMRALQDLVVAVTGAEVSIAVTTVDAAESSVTAAAHSTTETRETSATRVPSVAPELGEAFTLRADERLTIGTPTRGMRAYVAIRGGLDGQAVLGSVAYDSLSRMGTEPLRDGDALTVASDSAASMTVSDSTNADSDAEAETDPERGSTASIPLLSHHAILRVVAGPRDDWFTTQAQASLALQAWAVTAQSNRIGVRLDGVPLSRLRDEELPSEGVVRGSIQVPPNGLPLLFLADHPVTGGYPVIATVVDADLDRAAQLRPGDKLSFVVVDADSIGDACSETEIDVETADTPVRFSIEIDGRRHTVSVSYAVAAALEQLAAEGPADEFEQVLSALAAAAEMSAQPD